MSSEIPSLPPLEAAQPAAPAQAVSSAWRRPSAVIAAIALALLGWQWMETRGRLAELQEELARRLSEGDSVAREALVLTRKNQENLQDLQNKLGVLDARFSETQGQQMALEAMYQEFSRTRDDRVLSEVEQAVTIAAQQLQLAGNIQNALAALQTADARLASVDRPQWLSVRKALAEDIESLRALPQVDSAGVALRLETLMGRLDGLPLAFEARPKVLPPPRESEAGWLSALWLDFWNEFSQLVRIERMDRPDPALLAPSNAVFLRENLKLRLMNARLALLTRDGNTFREDMRLSASWLDRYFDVRNAAVAAARDELMALQKSPVGADLPPLLASQNALRAVLSRLERRVDAVPAAPAAPAPKAAARPARKN